MVDVNGRDAMMQWIGESWSGGLEVGSEGSSRELIDKEG